jgi:hypothetical protein
MIEELHKIGDIDSVHDFFEFKISIKTIIIIIIMWGIIAALIFVIMMGGINNSIDFIIDGVESTKKTIITYKDKASNNTVEPPSTKKEED